MEIHDLVLVYAPATMRQHTEITAANLIKISLESKQQIKEELYKVCHSICFYGNHERLTVYEKDPAVKTQNTKIHTR